MRGKRPKDRKCYILRIGDGTLVEVTREVYLEWYRSRRRERYQQERKQKHGVCSLEELEERGTPVISVTDSLEETAQLCGCSRKTIENRRKQVLKELNGKMREMGITGGCF